MLLNVQNSNLVLDWLPQRYTYSPQMCICTYVLHVFFARESQNGDRSHESSQVTILDWALKSPAVPWGLTWRQLHDTSTSHSRQLVDVVSITSSSRRDVIHRRLHVRSGGCSVLTRWFTDYTQMFNKSCCCRRPTNISNPVSQLCDVWGLTLWCRLWHLGPRGTLTRLFVATIAL